MGIPLVILGMHRSGTSALAGALAHAGIDAGPHLLPADPLVNARGFWEHADVVAIHDRLLAQLGSVWSDVRELPPAWWQRADIEPHQRALVSTLSHDFGNTPLWLLKDPRICRLLPMWTNVFQDLGLKPLYISMLRDPIEVTMSLGARDGIGQERAAVLWLLHVLDAEAQIRLYGGLRVTYAELLRDWRSTMQKIFHCLSTQDLDWESKSEAISAFLEPDLRRQRNAQVGSAKLTGLTAIAADLYRGLTEGHDVVSDGELEMIRHRITEYQHSHSELLAEIAHSDARALTRNSELARLQAEVAGMRQEIHRIKTTVSWRSTAPIRLVWNMLRRIWYRRI